MADSRRLRSRVIISWTLAKLVEQAETAIGNRLRPPICRKVREEIKLDSSMIEEITTNIMLNAC